MDQNRSKRIPQGYSAKKEDMGRSSVKYFVLIAAFVAIVAAAVLITADHNDTSAEGVNDSRFYGPDILIEGSSEKYALAYEILTSPGGSNGTVKMIGWNESEGYSEPSGGLIIPAIVTTDAAGIGGTYDITSIDDGAFSECGELTSITFQGSNLTDIGWEAFSKCGFTGDLVIPDSVRYIGQNAFDRCKFDGTLTLPENDDFKSISSTTFQGCRFTGDLVIPDSVESVGSYAFFGCTSFDGALKLSAAGNLKTIGEWAFNACKGLKGDIVIPDSVESIRFSAFGNCSGFDGTLILPNNEKFTEVENWTFSGCSKLKSVTIPKNVTTLGESVFGGCDGLNLAIVPDVLFAADISADITVLFTGNETMAGSVKGNNVTMTVMNRFIDSADITNADGDTVPSSISSNERSVTFSTANQDSDVFTLTATFKDTQSSNGDDVVYTIAGIAIVIAAVFAGLFLYMRRP